MAGSFPFAGPLIGPGSSAPGTPPPLVGTVRVPGDKSIGHRALLLGALAEGVVDVTGLGEGEDNHATQRILGQLGVRIEREGTSARVHGVGLDGLRAPEGPLDCGNSGTTMRLTLGILTGQPFEVELVGDESLSRRPMGRVLEPLGPMGLELLAAAEGGRAPLRVRGRRPVVARHYDSPIASAQVKSAVLLAGLYAEGQTTVAEPAPSRDHTERMLAWLRRPEGLASGGLGPLGARPIHVPGDLSSASFLLAAALLVPGSRVTIEGVGTNPTRTGFLEVLEAMGAPVERSDERERNHEPAADVTATWAPLRGAEVAGALSVRAIDELPLVATLAARAAGTTHIRDATELRVKESDRIARTAALLGAFGVPVDEHPDGLSIHGDPQRPLTMPAAPIDARGDHRIAMCASLLALLLAPRPEAPAPQILGRESIASSFPEFDATLRSLAGSPVPST